MGWNSSTSIGFVFILAFLSILKTGGFWNSSTSIVLVLILAFLSILKTAGFWNNQRQNFPPGPRPLPVIGNLLLFDLKRPYRTYQQLSKKYGPVFSVQMGHRKVVVISGYETVKEALVNQADAFAERPKIPVFEDLTKGNGVVFAHGENWKVMRRFTLTALRDFGMGKKAIEDRIVEEYGHLADTIASQEGNPIDASKIINAAVANIIVSILLGKRFDYKDSRFVRLQNLTNESMRLAGKPLVTIYNIFPYLGFLLRANKALLRNRDEFHAFVRVTFVEHLKNLDKNDQRSFIDAFLVKQQEEKSATNGYFHNGNLLSLVSNLFTAGVETISTTLNWGFLLMLKYPEIQKKVQEEIEQVIGSNPPRIEHRAQMPYTDAVIHEIQRFANILPLDLPHETAADVTLKGYFIPKGTYIIPLLTSVLKDQSQWEKPDMFYPEHFLDANGKFVKKDAFMPFSAGRRICAGETLAKMELFLFFTSLLQRFNFHPPPGVSNSDLDLSPAISFNVIPKPYKMCAVARS
ncbi:PREDICTED: cytochrome P450 2K1-like [Pseudopodoces humilis]|uniref:cytochrome P450 2K1-like n=1 Tax=Pseudopodoces humilis TaxID=181119 RepID=UPI0006B8510F|nr:PREDICTED: cytochrome P450 2K1-like [Pseudopodoces humilis]